MLGNIEKFAENQGLQTFFFKEKVSYNTAKDCNKFIKWNKFGVKVERKWSKYFKDVMRNGVGSGNIICVISHFYQSKDCMVENVIKSCRKSLKGIDKKA